MQLAGVGSGCTVAQLQESVWRGGRHPGGWKLHPGLSWGQKGPASFAQFFGVGVRASSLSWGYDEPEILRHSNRQLGPIGADAGHGYIQGGTSLKQNSPRQTRSGSGWGPDSGYVNASSAPALNVKSIPPRRRRDAYGPAEHIFFCVMRVHSVMRSVAHSVRGTDSRNFQCTVIGASPSHPTKSTSPQYTNGVGSAPVFFVGRNRRWTWIPCAR